MQDCLLAAQEALTRGDGMRALTLASQVLAEDDACSRAWLVAMQCYQHLGSADTLDPDQEITCGRCAIQTASRAEKYAVSKQVYQFYLARILSILHRCAETLADGKAVVEFYQRTVYFDAAGASQRAMTQDAPTVRAVLRALDACVALFEAIPDSALRRSAALRANALAVAHQWRKTYAYLEMRFELYHSTLSREMVALGLAQYARFLRTLPEREALLASPIPFNLYHLDPAACATQSVSFAEQFPEVETPDCPSA